MLQKLCNEFDLNYDLTKNVNEDDLYSRYNDEIS